MAKAEVGKTYAQILNNKVHWVFTSNELPEWNENHITVIDVTGRTVEPGYGYINGKIIIPQPSPAHELIDGRWVLNAQLKAQLEMEQRKALMTKIDIAVATIYNQYNPFQAEYELREKQAYAYIEGGYVGEVPEQVAAFAVPAKKTAQEAANIILQQAKNLRRAMAQLGVLRMRKYEVLDAPTLEAANTAANDILNNISLVAASLT